MRGRVPRAHPLSYVVMTFLFVTAASEAYEVSGLAGVAKVGAITIAAGIGLWLLRNVPNEDIPPE